MIIIETPAPPTRERLVLVPRGGCADIEGEPGRVHIITTVGRDPTDEDLARAGWVRASKAERETLDAIERAEKAERAFDVMRERAEKAERERDEARDAFLDCARAIGVVNETDGRVPEPGPADEVSGAIRYAVQRADRATGLELERDDVRRILGALDSDEDLTGTARRTAAAVERQAREIESLRAELARLTAPVEEAERERARRAPLDRALDALEEEAERERARHARPSQPEPKGRATEVPPEVHEGGWRAREGRREQCLVTRAVEAGIGRVTIYRERPGSDRWGVAVDERKATMQAPADVPATLARLLDGVTR